MEIARVVGIFIALMVTINPVYMIVSAQQTSQWVPDERVPGYLDDTFTPYLVADKNHTVHAFANQWIGEEHRQYAIVYRRWSLVNGWTLPVDIILLPSADAQVIGVFLDANEILHMVFYENQGSNGKVYYSHAFVGAADQVSAWSPPEVIAHGACAPIAGAIAGDDQGNLLIIYDGNIDGNGVYAIHSSNNGQNWSEPQPVFLTYDLKLSPYSLRLYSGQEGRVHAAWNVVTSLGVDVSLYYASYDLMSEKWENLALLENRIEIKEYFGPSYPSIVDNGKFVVIMYNSGNPFTGRSVEAGRPIQRVRMSNDGGQTWSDVIDPFPLHNGRSGEHSLVVDSNNVIHALFIQRIDRLINGQYNSIGGIWHSTLQGDHWDKLERIITTYAPHDVRAVISQGNILLAVWREDPGVERQHGVWFTYTFLNTPELPSVPWTTPVPSPISTPLTFATHLVPTATTIKISDDIDQEDPMPVISTYSVTPLIISIVPVVIILVVIVIFSFFSKVRRY
jgi:hypothetical protein